MTWSSGSDTQRPGSQSPVASGPRAPPGGESTQEMDLQAELRGEDVQLLVSVPCTCDSYTLRSKLAMSARRWAEASSLSPAQMLLELLPRTCCKLTVEVNKISDVDSKAPRMLTDIRKREGR